MCMNTFFHFFILHSDGVMKHHNTDSLRWMSNDMYFVPQSALQ